jgi:3-phenylpropionate/trans-cinnamate dioxygenase ferredoxin subunit
MGTWQKITRAQEIPEGRGIRIEAASHRVALFRIGATVHAIGDRCSHAEASLAEGDLFDHEIECPRHGAAFDVRTGEPQSLPATQPVPVYETKIEEGDLFLFLDDQEES